jgi:hypothetical protein
MKYDQFISENSDKSINYQDLLSLDEWKEKRAEIIERDDNHCQDCGFSASFKHEKFIIAYNYKDEVRERSLNKTKKLISEYRAENDLKELCVMEHKDLNKFFILNSKEIVLLSKDIYNKIIDENIESENLVINYISTKNGLTYPILNLKGKFDAKNVDIPYILDNEIIIQVHHKYYIRGRKPWEYDNDALITLCNWCHWDLHQNLESITVYDEDMKNPQNLIPCSRCGGMGEFPEYSHIQNGICFKCRGSRFERFRIIDINNF